MAGFRIEGNTSGNVAEVTAANEIKVISSDQVAGLTTKPAALDTSGGVVNLQSSQLFIDTFDAAFDTTNNWNTAASGGGGSAFVFSTASITGGTGTTANGFSQITSRQNFQPGNPGYLEVQMNIGLPDGAAPIANSYRAWGLGTPQASPTAANPIVNGLVFEVTTAGKMFVVCYQSGSRAVIQDLSSSGNSKQPLDASAHKYFMWVRGDIGFFAIDTRTNIVATFLTGALGPDITTNPLMNQCVAGAVAPVSNAQVVNNMTCLGDTAQSTSTLSDPQFPFRQATVKAASTAVAAIDIPLVVALHPSSPVPGVAQASTTSGQTGILTQGAVTTAAPTYTTAQTSPLSLTTTGGLRAAIQGNAGAAIDGAIAAAPPANALQIGIKAATANPTNATAGNQVAIMGDKAGRPVVTIGQARELVGKQQTTIANTTTGATIITGTGSEFHDLSALIISIVGFSAANTITISDGAATVMVLDLPDVAALSDKDPLVMNFAVPIPQTTAAGNWTATHSVATGTSHITAIFIRNL